MASSSSSPYGWEDPSRTRRPSNGGNKGTSAKPQGRPMPTPRRVVLNSPYSNMPAAPMVIPEDIRPPVEDESESSNASTDDFWEQDDDLRQIIQGQLKEKSTDAPAPMPLPATPKDPLKLNFPEADTGDADTPWEEWQTVAETPRDSGHATPFEPIGAPTSSPGFPQPSNAMPEPQRPLQMSMPEPTHQLPPSQPQVARGYFGMPIPARRFTEDDDLDSPSQHIPGRYPIYPKSRLPIQEEDDTPPAPSAVSLVSTPSIYPPVQASVGVQADLLPDNAPTPPLPYTTGVVSPPVPSIYSESSSLLPDVETPPGHPLPSWAPPLSSTDSDEPVWGKPTAPLKLGNKPAQLPSPVVMPTSQQKPSGFTIPQPHSSHHTHVTPDAPSKPFTQPSQSQLSTPDTSPSQHPAKPTHVAAQKPPAPSSASTSYTRPDKPAHQLGTTNGNVLNANVPLPKPSSTIHAPSSSGDITLTPTAYKPPPKPTATTKLEATPPKPLATTSSVANLKPPRPEPESHPSHISTASTHTRYVNMLLALDDIPQWFNLLASFFTWVLLAGFLLFPGTFTSLQEAASSDTTPEFQRRILTAVTHVPLFVLAWVCCGIGAAGMIWLWWRWNANYIWVTGKIFLPGFLNGLAGVITTLVNVFGVQDGQFSTTAKVTIIVVSCTAGVCGSLLIFYQLWLLRRVKAEHDRIMGEQAAGKHGEGVLKSLMKSKNSEKRGV